MVKDYLDSERKKPTLRHYSFWLQQEIFCMHHPTDRIVHTMAFVIPVVEHWLEHKNSSVDLFLIQKNLRI